MMLISSTWNYIQKNPVVILLVGCGSLILHVLFAHGGCFENDDFVYAYYAVANGKSVQAACDFCDHFALRWMPVYATSAFYYFFGISEATSSLFSLTCFLLTGVLLYFFLSKEKPAIVLTAFILFFLNYSTVFFSHRLLADPGICFFNFLAYFFYHRQLFYKSKRATIDAVIFSLALMLAMLSKETVMILLPFWLTLLGTDIYKKRNYRFWTRAILFFLTFAAIYLLYFQITTGDWLYRYHILQTDNLQGGIAFEPRKQEYLSKRLTYELWQVFLFNGDMQYLLFAIAGIIYLKSVFKDLAVRHVAGSFALLLCCCNFMSYSFTEYIPLWSDPRHFLFLMPFAVITAAYMVIAFLYDPSKYIGVLYCFIIADIFLMFSDLGGTKYIYYAISLILFARWLSFIYGNERKYTLLLCGLFVTIMAVNYLYDFVITRYNYYYDQKMIVDKYFKNTAQKSVVFAGDRITTGLGDYLLDFKSKNVRFANVDTCVDFSFAEATKYHLLLNYRYNTNFAKAADSLILTPGLNQAFELIRQINTAKLYEVKEPGKMEMFKHYSTSKF